MLYYAGQYDEAAQLLRGVIASDPEFPAAHYELGRVLLATGDRQAAMTAFAAEPSGAWRYFGMPLGFHALNRTADAGKALATLVANSSGSEFQVAEAYAYFGDIDQAFQWLGRARDLRDPGIIVVRRDPMLRPLERDPRYAPFLASVGLTPP